MATQKQIDANRSNAQRSTGPKTPEGLLNSKFNALKHGMAASTACLPHENAIEYEETRAQLYSQFEPVGKLEQMLVDQIARAHWKMLRAERVELRTLDLELHLIKGKYGSPQVPDDDGSLSCVFRIRDEARFANQNRYRTQAENSFYKAINALHKAQAVRMRKEKILNKIDPNTIAIPSTEPPAPRKVNGFVPRPVLVGTGLQTVARETQFRE